MTPPRYGSTDEGTGAGLRRAAWPILLLLLLAAASVGCRSAEEKLRAERFVDGYYEALRDGRIDDALALCHPDFFASTPREAWVEKLESTEEHLGVLRDFHQKKWTMEILPNGTFTTFVYDVRYARFESEETITVVAPTREAGLFIFGHHIRSDGMP